MEKLVDLSKKSGLSSTIDTLAGISNLEEINKICKDLSKRAVDLFDKKDAEVTSNRGKNKALIEEKKKFEGYKEGNLLQIETYKEELSKAEAKKEELEQFIKEAETEKNFVKFKSNFKRKLSV